MISTNGNGDRLMIAASRRKLIKRTALAWLGSWVGTKIAVPQQAPSAGGRLGLQAARTQSAKRAKSKRDLMLEVLHMDSQPDYVPAGFFMHFGVRGDAAVKAHLDYFRATGMDFVKIQFDEVALPHNDQIKTPGDWSKMPILTE